MCRGSRRHQGGGGVQYKEKLEERNERILLFSGTFDTTVNLPFPLFVYVEVKQSLWVTKSCLILEGFNVGRELLLK
jgi:hypothetical protein